MLQCLECTYNTKIKCNFERHIKSKHKKGAPKDVISAPKDVISAPKDVISTLKDVISAPKDVISTLNVVIPNQCEQCHKIFTVKSSLTRHLLICKGPIINEKICEYCKKKLSSKRNKENHLTTCKEKALTIINNNDNSITNIQNNNIQNNNTIIYNIITFSENPRKPTQFIKDDMTYRKMSDIINTSGGNDIHFFEKMYRLVLDTPGNRCIIKKNMKLKHSKAFTGKGWIQKSDKQLYPKLFNDICALIMELLEDNEDRLSAKYKAVRIDNLTQFIDDIQTYELGDTIPTDKEDKAKYDDFIECLDVLKMVTNDYSKLLLESIE
jgi:hypothetical protein